MKIFITGGTGFVGQHLIRFLKAKQAEENSDMHFVALTRKKLQTSGEITWVYAPSVLDSEYYAQSLMGVDVVVHLAAAVHTESISEEEFFRINVEGSKRLAQAAAVANIPHFIYISSISAVGSKHQMPINNFTNCEPESAYGKSKLAAERELLAVLTNSNTALTILRPVVIYGENDPGNMSRLVKLCKLKVPLPFRAVRNKRSVLSVENLVSLIYRCMTCTASKNEIFMVSDLNPISIEELIVAIYGILGSRPRLFKPPAFILKIIDRLSSRSNTKLLSYMIKISSLTESMYVDMSYVQSKLDWIPPYDTVAAMQRWLGSPSKDT